MSDFLFANPVKTPSIDPSQKYLDKFNLSKDEFDRLELIVNTLASDFASTPLFSVTSQGNDQWLIEIQPSDYRTAKDLHTIAQKYIDGKATINPDRNLVKLLLAKKVYAQLMVQWLQDYKVVINEFNYPIDDFIN